MNKQILFIQGGGAGTHDQWDNRLVDRLSRDLGTGYDIAYPRMPNEDTPSYSVWKAALACEMAALDDGAILVGHSIGATILINTLADAPPVRKLAGVLLIAAPFVGAGGWSSEEIQPMDDLDMRLPSGTPLFLYHGSEDDTAPPTHLDLYRRAIPRATCRRLHGRDHQLNDDLTEVAADISALRWP